MIAAADLEDRLGGLRQIGRTPHGETSRLAWTPEDERAGAWFSAQARGEGLRVERDPAGNRWAVPAVPPPWRCVGSHLDSVAGGGAYDGALGVAAGFAVAAATAAPVAVVAFADEEGARFNTPTFGSRALAGALDWPAVLDRRDAGGVRLADALADAGIDPSGVPTTQAWSAKVACFLELHIDQSTELHAAGAPFGLVGGLAARARVRATFTGRPDHAGTTPVHDRADALGTAAALVGCVEVLAAGPGHRATVGRLDVEPGAATTIAGVARAWVDARATDDDRLDALVARIEAAAHDAARVRRTRADVRLDSRSRGCAFDPGLLGALRRAAPSAPAVPTCWAGHDAGWVAQVAPAAMVLVRNETGVSHSPAEHVDLADAAAAATAMAAVLEEEG